MNTTRRIEPQFNSRCGNAVPGGATQPGVGRRRSVAATAILTAGLLVWASASNPLGQGGSGPVISEFLAANDRGLTDRYGEHSDWIELFNAASTNVNLSGWHLTDRAGNLTQWTFPSTNLPAGGYLVVFASGKGDAVAGQELHTNFQLDADGEYLALVQGTNVVSQFAPAFPKQYADVSYGLGQANELTYFSPPTPGAPNSGAVLGVVADTKFSPDRGLVFTNINVVITTATTGADVSIRYTLDSGDPTMSSPLFSGSILVASSVVVRAKAFKPDYKPTDIDTHTYIFPADVLRQPTNPPGFPPVWYDAGMTSTTVADYAMDPVIVTNPTYSAILTNALQCLPTISIVTPRSNLFDTATGIYVNPTNNGVAWERPVSVEWITTNNTTGFQEDGGLRIHGAVNRKMSHTRKKSFSLRFKDDYGPTKLNYDVFADPSATTSFDVLVLRGGGIDQFLPYPPSAGTDAQYVLDEFVRRCQLATGSPAPHGMFAHLYLDGLYWGLYNVVEKPAESFCEAYFGADKSTWDVIDNSGAIEGNMDIWTVFKNMSYNRENGPPPSNADYQFIQGRNPDRTPNPAYTNFLDVANYVDYLITQFWSGNSDWPANNWFAVRSRNPGSTGFKWLVWDAERSLDFATYVGLDTDNTKNFTGACGAYSWLRQNAEFCLFFGDRAHKFLFNDGALTTNAVIPRYRELANIVGPAIVAESARWGDQSVTNRYTPADWTAQRDYILNTYLPQRTGKVLQHFKNRGLYPLVDAPVFSRHGGIFTNGFSLTMTAPNSIYYTLDGRDPREYGTGNIVGTLYTAPLLPTYSVQVKARARSDAGVWSALNEALFVRDAPTTLRVTEVMYHPLPAQGGELGHGWTNDDFQFIEIQNVGSQTVGLAGTKFTDGITFDFTDGGVSSLAPGEYAVVVKNIAAFTNRYAALPGIKVAGQFQSRYDFAVPQLARGGERVVLTGPTNAVLDSFTYRDGSVSGWPMLADGYGRSLVRRDPASAADPNDPASWRASSQNGGSPGAADPAPGPTPAILINEILAHTDWPQMDSVELYNPTNVAVELTGWWLTDDPLNLQKYQLTNTVIAAGGYHVLTSNDFGSVFLLSSAGEKLVLSSADLAYSHTVTFPASENGVSLGRYVTSQGAEHFPPQKSVTLGAANSGPRVGPVIISEIYYNPTNSPAGLAHEFLELSNISTQTVTLSVPGAGGWRLNGVSFTFTNGTTMPPGGQILLVRNTTTASAFRTANNVTNSVPIFIYTGALDNGGEFLHLEKPHVDAAGVTNWISVDEVQYNDMAPWPVTADGGGASLERIDYQGYGNDPINWRASAVNGGTPGQSDAQLVDLDGDQMPDWWEDLYLGGFLNGVAGADLDGDGFTNLQEYQAGTDPRFGVSRLAISSLRRAVDGWELGFASVSGKVYLVEYATNLTRNTDWKILPVEGSTNGVAGDGTVIRIVDPAALDQPMRFYRIHLKP